MNQEKKNQVIRQLESAYMEAKAQEDTELTNAIARAVVVLSYSGNKRKPTWEEMLRDYQKQHPKKASEPKKTASVDTGTEHKPKSPVAKKPNKKKNNKAQP